MTTTPHLTADEREELLGWVTACQSAFHFTQMSGLQLKENRQALVDYVEGLLVRRTHTPEMKGIAERNLRAYLTKASFGSAVDRLAALECVDVLTDPAPPKEAQE